MVKQRFHLCFRCSRGRTAGGFSLVELLVAIAVFLIIGTATVHLFTMHVPLATTQKNQTDINVAMRSAVAQMEMDVANAGSGYYLGAELSDAALGVTLINTVSNLNGNPCNTGTTYNANCFDTMNVIALDPTVAPLHPSSSATALADVNTSSNTSAYVTTGSMTQTAANTLAALYHAGDELLWINTGTPSLITTTTLTQPGTVVSGAPGTFVVQLTYTGTTGFVNTQDRYYIANTPDSSAPSMQLTNAFPNATSWVMRLNPIQYAVNSANAADPQLTRQVGTGTAEVIADQVIGFRVGAYLQGQTTSQAEYNFDSSTYFDSSTNKLKKYDWNLIQSVHISILGRTAVDNSQNAFHNPYDGGAYMIQGVSVTINPRNLSMANINE